MTNKTLEFERDMFLSNPVQMAHALGYHDCDIETDEGPIHRTLDPLHFKLLRDLWENPHPRKIKIMPRGSLKTTCCTIMNCIRKVLSDRDCRILIDSETYSKSKRYLAAIKGHLTKNETILRLFGDVTTDPGWREESIVMRGRTSPHPSPTIDTCGLDVDKTGMHVTDVIVNDLQSDVNTQTLEMRDKAWNHFLHLRPMMDAGAKLLVECTRWHLDDIPGRIISSEKLKDQYEIFHVKAMEDDGTINFPTLLPMEKLMEEKELLGPYIFSAQYQNVIIPDEKRIFRPEWITEHQWTKMPEGVSMMRITTVDPAIETDKRKNDYTAIVTCDHDKARNVYVVDARQGRWQVDEITRQICSVINIYGPSKVGIEEVSFQKALRMWIQREFNERGIRKGILPLKVSTRISKSMRIERLQPVAARGQLHLNKSQWELERQMIDFPDTKHDDMLDALASQLELSPVIRIPVKQSEVGWFEYITKRFAPMIKASRDRERSKIWGKA